jgi:hypothetical protein
VSKLVRDKEKWRALRRAERWRRDRRVRVYTRSGRSGEVLALYLREVQISWSDSGCLRSVRAPVDFHCLVNTWRDVMHLVHVRLSWRTVTLLSIRQESLIPTEQHEEAAAVRQQDWK